MANEIREIRDATESQLKKTDEIIASHEAVADLISEVNNALSEVNNTLASGFTMLGAGLRELCFITEDGFREVIDRLDLQNETLNAIKEILEKPLDTQAKELRKRAEKAYLNNWFDEAEIDLSEAEKKNYQDFIVHQILGNIYYYHKGNYQKALNYYQKAAKYATPVSKKHASNALICAAMVYYRLDQLSDAFKSTKMAMELLSDDSGVLYNHACYSAKIGHMDEFIDCLRGSILKDPNYLIAADRDEMFSGVKGHIKKLAEDMRDEKRKAVNNVLQKIASALQKIELARKEAGKLGIADFTLLNKRLAEVNNLCADVNNLCARNSYFDFLKAEQVALKAEQLARKAYDESVSEWIQAKNASITKLKSNKDKVKGSGCLSVCLSLVIWLVVLPLFWFGLFPSNVDNVMAGVIGAGFWLVFLPSLFILSYIVKKIKLMSIKAEIEKENNALTRFSNLTNSEK